eukprot:scaffold6029_cov63-Phaeocystis_antarctica.AAC.6
MAWMRSLSLKYCDTSIRCGVCTKAVKYTGSGGSSAPLSATVNTYTSGGVGMVAAGASAKKSGARSECASSSLGPASARSASAPMSELVMETWRSISAVEVAPPAPSSRYTAMAMPGGGGSKASPRAATGCSWNLHSLGFLAVRCDADTLSGSADEFLARLALRPANRSDAGVQTMPLSTRHVEYAQPLGSALSVPRAATTLRGPRKRLRAPRAVAADLLHGVVAHRGRAPRHLRTLEEEELDLASTVHGYSEMPALQQTDGRTVSSNADLEVLVHGLVPFPRLRFRLQQHQAACLQPELQILPRLGCASRGGENAVRRG